MTEAASPIVRARNLSKVYGATKALDHVSFDIEPGRIVGLIGPNGAGKTTALKAILGLVDFEGELSVLGFDPRKQRAELMEQVCFIADVAVLPRWIRVSEAVEFVAGVHPRFSREKCQAFLAHTKIQPGMRVRELSKGMIVQLHLALVMAIDAKLLVLDEPTLGLDITYRKRFYRRLLEDYMNDERTLLITTHQVDEIEFMLSDIMFIRDGVIVLDAPMEEVGRRFIQVVVTPDKAEQALALKPTFSETRFGQTVMVYDGVDRQTLEGLGTLSTPTLSDLFVALMTREDGAK